MPTPVLASLARRARVALTDPPRAVRAVRKRLWGRTRIERRPFASFVRADGTAVELWAGYRDTVKSRWRGYWWQTRVLLELHRRVLLPPELGSLADELLRARTLPASLDEIACAVQPLADLYPEHVLTFASDERTGLRELEPAPTEEVLTDWERAYANSARATMATLRASGLASPARALEVGCGSGYMTLAVAATGVPTVVGCDIDVERYGGGTGRRQLWERLVPSGAEVRFEHADAASLPYEDASFDLVFSSSVLEHVRDPRRVLGELRRVLRAGGFAYHHVDPWFSPQGGHSLCILDFPWGHVRLSRDELARYLLQLRPHEAAAALQSYDRDFQSPRLTLSQLAAVFDESGFETLGLWATTLALADGHRRLLTSRVLAESQRVYPAVTRRDLLTDGITVVARAA